MVSERRLNHSLEVSATAVLLAKDFGCDPERAALAGLVHDCARDLDGDVLLKLAGDYGLYVSSVERQCPLLLHGPVGAALCRDRFGIAEREVLRAVALHTNGSPDMGLLDKVVYIADKIEPGRRYDGVTALREAAKKGPDEGMIACLAHFMYYLINKGEVIHPDMVNTWNILTSEVEAGTCIHTPNIL
jgi:predicted HD superfamily hydrolase involved in NAD metabolism